MRKSDFVLASVIISAVAGLGMPCAAQLTGVVASSGTAPVGAGVATTDSITMAPGMFRMLSPVTGQPYSGEMETEHTQTLSNGTHINQKRDVSRMYRDSQGRTRTERFLSPPLLQPEAAKEQGPRLVQIYDPVEGYSYTLETRTHIAHRVALQTLPEAPARKAQPSADPANGQPALPPLGRLGAGANNPRRPNMKREPLGKEMIDEIEAEGWRTTITTAAGAIGNDKPITHVCETWHATELQILVLSKCTDPRSGHSTMRLKNLDRSEPDPSLFMVPSDYTIVDDRDRFTMNFSER